MKRSVQDFSPSSPPAPDQQPPQEYTEKIQPANISDKLDSLMKDPFLKKAQIGLYIYDLTAKCPIYEKGKEQSMRPASTMKVITAVTALAQLGTRYEYHTGLYLKGQLNKGTWNGNLYVKGGFDPLLDKAALQQFTTALQKKGIRRIKGNLILDLSMKEDKEAGWGWCWDDRNPSLSPLLYKEKDNFGPAFRQYLAQKGISLQGSTTSGRVSASAQLLTTYTTSIDQALRPMMKMSDNQVAESMFYQIAAQSGTPFATHRTAAAYIKQFIRSHLQLTPENYRIADGSGLSQYNYVTPELLVHTLRYAYEHQDIYRHLLPALPVAGEDGTLKDRMRYTTAHGNVQAKTGTVTGICSLAGYATTRNKHRLCFAIINQGQMRGREARELQDKICYILTE